MILNSIIRRVKMSLFHENSVKWFNEQLKKKCKTKTSTNVEEDLKQCIYCPKIFKSSAFVIKHIFKRHSEPFLRHHKKFMDTTNNELGLDHEAVLINYLKSEFCSIKSELEIVKKVVTHRTQVGDNTKKQVICSTGCQECIGSNTNPHENEQSLDMSKHFVANIPQEDFKKLQEKVEEMSQRYKEIVSSNKEMAYLLEDRICRRLKKELIKDFENLLIRNKDSDWKPHLSQLKKDLNKLEQLVEQNAQKIESPEVQQEVRNKIDEQIQSFFENYGIVEERSRTSSKGSRKGLSDSPLNMNAHRVNRRAKSIFTSRLQNPNLAQTSVKTYDPQQFKANVPETNISGSQGSTSSRRQLDTSMKTKNPHLQADVSVPNEVQPPSILKSVPDSIHKIGARKAKVLFVERLKDFCISLETKQLSEEEYERKDHLVNAENRLLCQKYKNFQELYASLDSHADELVKAHMDRKFRRQLRFSDSINLQASASKEEIVPDRGQDKSSSLSVKVISPFMNQSEFMQDLGPGDDFHSDEDCEKPNSNFESNLAQTGSKSRDIAVTEHGRKKTLSPVEKVTSPLMDQSEFMQDLGACGDFNDEENCEKLNSNCARNMDKISSKSKDKVFLERERKETFSPVEKVTSPFMNQSKFVQDSSACGDFNAEKNMMKGQFVTGVSGKKSEKFKFQEHVLPQNVASNASFPEPPGRVLYPGPSNDHLQPIEEFSELSSLESDTDLFLNEFDQI